MNINRDLAKFAGDRAFEFTKDMLHAVNAAQHTEDMMIHLRRIGKSMGRRLGIAETNMLRACVGPGDQTTEPTELRYCVLPQDRVVLVSTGDIIVFEVHG